jgi:hypothetical protein
MEATTRLAQNFQLGLGVKVDRAGRKVAVGLEGLLHRGGLGYETWDILALGHPNPGFFIPERANLPRGQGRVNR